MTLLGNNKLVLQQTHQMSLMGLIPTRNPQGIYQSFIEAFWTKETSEFERGQVGPFYILVTYSTELPWYWLDFPYDLQNMLLLKTWKWWICI